MREIVVRELDAILSHEEYILYASQLLQATKWEVYDNNALIRLLLRQAIEFEDFAYVLYWQLQVHNWLKALSSSRIVPIRGFNSDSRNTFKFYYP